tara:strand:+ start:1068 stop:1880 length:813 start_codon:yes stop_codon:yes gene_type:complete
MQGVREFWDSRPCNIRHSSKPLGTKEYFEEVKKKKYKVEPHIVEFADFNKWKGKKVLEIGCGIGTDSIEFAKHGAELTVIDISQKSLDICKKRFEVYNLKAEFILGDAEELDTYLSKDDKYDLIYAWGSIHHSLHPEVIVKNLKKYLKIGGIFKLMVYSKVSMKMFQMLREEGIWDFSSLSDIIPKYAEAQRGCPIAYTYTFEEIKELLTDFNIESIRKDHIFPYKVESYIKNEYVIEDCFKNMIPKDFKILEKELGWHTLCTACFEGSS